jgi:hypothetical protein
MIERTVSFFADSRSRGAQNLIVSRASVLSSRLLLLCVSWLESEVHVDLTSMSSRWHRSYESCPRPLLHVNPSARVSAAEALDQEWFASRIRSRSQMLDRRLLLKKCGTSLGLRIPPLENVCHIARSPTPQTRDDCSPHLPRRLHHRRFIAPSFPAASASADSNDSVGAMRPARRPCVPRSAPAIIGKTRPANRCFTAALLPKM